MSLQSRTFLATTALEEFWDFSQPILFLGDWCKVENRKKQWENLDAIVLQNAALKSSRSYEAFIYTKKIFEELLPELSKQLNIIHHTQHSLRYWQIIIGPFLLWYIQTLYHRFLLFKNCLFCLS